MISPDELLTLFMTAADAARDAVSHLTGTERHLKTARPGQYALDVLADEAALSVLHPAGVAVVSEESGRSGPDDAAVTIVVDPVDGSTNCSRGIPYWAVSLCALDREGPLCALVRNQATGVATTAVRGRGAWRDGQQVWGSGVERVEDAVVALSGWPRRRLAWSQFRSLGSAALMLCDLAAGVFDGYVDASRAHAPWDYLGGLLACVEAGAVAVDAGGLPLAVADPGERRQVLAAATPVLLGQLRAMVT